MTTIIELPQEATLLPTKATSTPTSIILPSKTAVPPTPTLATPTVTPAPPTATTIPPTVTAVPSTATAIPPTATATLPTAAPPPAPINQGINLELTPRQPQGYLSQFRLVAYYGSPLGVGLGILGNQSRPQTLRLLRETIADYAPLSDRPILPTYHMVITVANSTPPEYRHHVSLAVIEEWVASAKESGVAVIIDIQPGRADLMTEFNRVRHLLYEPHVHLAIDPEFVMNDQQIPLQNIGQLDATQINELQLQMNGIGYEIGLNRVLIIHQFKDSMVPNKSLIEPYPFVELVIDGDGVGPPGPKIRNYNQYAGEPGFEYGGFKLFPRDGDNPVMSPDWVMSSLTPQPVIIIYQ